MDETNFLLALSESEFVALKLDKAPTEDAFKAVAIDGGIRLFSRPSPLPFSAFFWS